MTFGENLEAAFNRGINALKSEMTIGTLFNVGSYVYNLLNPEPTTREIMAKLNYISDQLSDISHNIKSLEGIIKCQVIESFLDDICVKLFALKTRYIGFIDRRVTEDDLRSLYNDNGQGINYILSRFQYFVFQEARFENMVLNCALCKSSYLDEFRRFIRNIYMSIIMHLKIHYMLNRIIDPIKIDFDYEKFENHFNNTWAYYDKYVIPRSFKKYKYRKDDLQRIANDKISAEQIRNELKRLYDYFDWDVIIYPKMHGFDKHCVKYVTSDYFSGGIEFFLRELNNEKCGLIAWYLPGTDNQSIKTGHFSDNAQENSDQIFKKNANLSYVLTVHQMRENANVNCPDCSGSFKTNHHHFDTIGFVYMHAHSKNYHKVCSYSGNLASLSHPSQPNETVFSA